MKMDWLPDWKNEKEYPDFFQINKKELAWEFLRRNPIYQKDYADYKELGDDGYIEKYLLDKTVKIQGQRLIVTAIKKKGDSRGFTGMPDAWLVLSHAKTWARC
jgi:hypothetical protein